MNLHLKNNTRAILILAVCVCGALLLTSCDTIMTDQPTAGDEMDSPLDDLSTELTLMFVAGDENFGRVFTVDEGLGPIFNNTACGSCHSGDGRATPAQALIRFSQGSDLILELGGPQLQDKAIPGVTPETLPPGVQTSKRLPPPVFGVGLIENIPEATILAYADSNDQDNDGISGRPNFIYAAGYVPESEVGGGSGLHVGRFGRKANVSSLIQQVVEAYRQDMGITSDFDPIENPNPQTHGVAIGDRVPDPEISAAEVLQTVMYIRLLKPPARGEVTTQVSRGEQSFLNSDCAKCHVPTMKTGPNAIGPLNEVDAQLYSDLLLHDMGPVLADNRPDGDANGSEWKTAPLWGTRIVRDFLGGNAFFLHDGRATSLDQAIRLHGGEAENAKNAYLNLSEEDRKALIAFLESL